MDVQLIGSLFQFIGVADCLSRQLALFPGQHQSVAHDVRQCCTKNKTTSVDTDKPDDLHVLIVLSG